MHQRESPLNNTAWRFVPSHFPRRIVVPAFNILNLFPVFFIVFPCTFPNVTVGYYGDFDSFFTSAQLLLEFFSHVADIERLKWGNVL